MAGHGESYHTTSHIDVLFDISSVAGKSHLLLVELNHLMKKYLPNYIRMKVM
jgi:hypothetical protein